MKKMVKLTGMIALTLLLTAYSAYAQPGHGKGQRGQFNHWGPDSCRVQLMVDDLAKELSLSDKQRHEIEELHYAHMAEAQELRGNYRNDCVRERNARLELREKIDIETRKVLDKGQQEKYDDFISERRGPHGRHNGNWK